MNEEPGYTIVARWEMRNQWAYLYQDTKNGLPCGGGGLFEVTDKTDEEAIAYMEKNVTPYFDVKMKHVID